MATGSPALARCLRPELEWHGPCVSIRLRRYPYLANLWFRPMAAFRHHLRLLSAAWIVFQVTSLSTLVPRACCMAHQSAASASTGGHDQGATAHCPTPPTDADAAPRPMHHDHGQMHEAAPAGSAPAPDCALRGTCGGPTAALLALLSADGVLTESVAAPTDFPAVGDTLPSTAQLIRHFEPPDAPPPRA